MPQDILIFSDGTGQSSGVFLDEARSNFYKLYRAMRCGPDSSVDPSRQIAFYDPGLGTPADGADIQIGSARMIRNFVSQATGLGLTSNIIDCYACILSAWQPGSRIFMFGFSRGAYTVRCVGGVLAACGVPTHGKGGGRLNYSPASIRAIATEAVKEVYQYGASIDGDPFKGLRAKRAAALRASYGSASGDFSNAFPHFIGVFDTVAALGVPKPLRLALMALGALASLCLLAVFAWAASQFFGLFRWWFVGLTAGAVIGAAVAYVRNYVTRHPTSGKLHRANWGMRFYDETINRRVAFC